MSREKVAIGIPYYRQVEGPTLLSAMELAAFSARFIDMLPIGSPGAYVEQNRNAVVRFAFDSGIEFDWLFWMDTDMIFPPDTLLRLIAHGKDIIGCNYRTRTPPYMHAGHYIGEDGKASVDLRNIHKPGVVPMFQLPTGLLLTRFDIYRRPEWEDVWFDASVRGPRDDIYFCRKAREMGYEVFCDQDLTAKVKHRDMLDIEWFRPDQVQIVRGAGLMQDTGVAEGKERAKLSKAHFERMTSAA